MRESQPSLARLLVEHCANQDFLRRVDHHHSELYVQLSVGSRSCSQTLLPFCSERSVIWTTCVCVVYNNQAGTLSSLLNVNLLTISIQFSTCYSSINFQNKCSN